MATHQKSSNRHLLIKIAKSGKWQMAILWMIFTFILSSMSKGTAEKLKWVDFVGMDKLGHLVVYAIFSFLWILASETLVIRKRAIQIGLSVSILFGILMELGQFLLFEGRYFEVMDIIANIIGSIFGLVLFVKFIK